MSGFNLYIEGEKIQYGSMPIYVGGQESSHSSLNLFHQSIIKYPTSGELNLFCSQLTCTQVGNDLVCPIEDSFILHTLRTESLIDGGSSEDDLEFSLYVRGRQRFFGEPTTGGGSSGSDSSTQRGDVNTMPLYLETSNGLDNGTLNLYTSGLNSIQDTNNNLSLFTFSETVGLPTQTNASAPLHVFGFIDENDDKAIMPLVLFGKTISSTLNQETINASFSLFVSKNSNFTWNASAFGVSTEVDDEPFISVDPTDAIRGVELICYGDCITGTCEELVLRSHDTDWFSVDCLDGGIFRAENTYTDLNNNAFGSSVPYSGHFYGARKFTGLEPFTPYSVNIKGSSGSSVRIPAPKELNNWEFTSNREDGDNDSLPLFSGLKLIGDAPYASGGRNQGDKYGSSVSMTQDLLAVGSPNFDIDDVAGVLEDDNDITMNNAGTVFLYRRGAEPLSDAEIVSDKAGWDLEAQLFLPSGILRDYYKETILPLAGTDATVIERKWYLGQEGRNFGQSLSTCIIDQVDLASGEKPLFEDDKQLVVVGAPNASWTRTFAAPAQAEHDILLMVFTDEFSPSVGRQTYNDILNDIKQNNLLYKYYSKPAIDITIKVIIFQPMDFTLQPDIDFPEPKPTFILKKSILRHTNDVNGTSEFQNRDDDILQQIKDAYFEMYPTNDPKQPSILGVYVDNSRSLGTTAIEPALSRFKSFYQDRVFNNGLQDVFNTPSSGAVLETVTDDENWIQQSRSLLDFTLDSGRLITKEFLSLLTDPEEFGSFNTDLEEFNEAPASGGAVYIFEKESGAWNLIQELASPTTEIDVDVDRFGKAVEISKNGEVIIVGSPYMDEALTVYEYDYDEKERLYSNVEKWVDYHIAESTDQNVYPNLKFNIDELRKIFDDDEDVFRSIYAVLNPDQKYRYRTDAAYWGAQGVIEEYKKIYEYKYSDIEYKGSYTKLLERFAPTSRMGYSVAVNASGTSLAIGCPTDSLDQSDDSNLYYHPTNSGQILWPSHTNAGSVRVFDARKYYPHSKIVEYGKFGNKTKSFIDEGSESQFAHYSGVYDGIDKTFHITDFNDFDIPEDAGIVFIICPEVNFANDVVIGRLQAWLDLGDRNLVLVGNNSTFEENSAFYESNEIVNDILAKLDSAMTLKPTIGMKRSLLGDNACQDVPNIMPVSPPDNSIESYIDNSSNLHARGVSHIAMKTPNVPNKSSYFINVNQIMYENYTCDSDYTQYNNYCSPPLQDGADLRSSWRTSAGVRNWPNIFDDVFEGSRQPPVPLYTSAEVREPFTLNIPEVPARSGIFLEFDLVQSDASPEFGDIIDSNIKDFAWSSTETDYTYLNTNYGNNTNPNRFFDPQSKVFTDPLIQSEGSNGVENIKTEAEVSDKAYFSAEERLPNNFSKVYLISSLRTELLDKLYSGGDRNINFYFNIAAKNRFGGSHIAQLNAFSGRSNFTDAISGSALELVFTNNGNTVDTNVNISQLVNGNSQGKTYDVCWVANPLNSPSDSEVREIKLWMSNGKKKLVVTYDNPESAQAAKDLCEALELSMAPLYLPQRKKFANNKNDTPKSSRFYSFNNSSRFVGINDNNRAIRFGFDAERDSISTLTLDISRDTFIPISLGRATAIAQVNHGISDDKYIDVGFSFMKTGICKVDFAVQPNTAYRISFETIAFSKLETEPLNVYITNCNGTPTFESADTPPTQDIINWDNDNNNVSVFTAPVGIIGSLGSHTSFRKIHEFNIKTLSNVDSISVFIEGNNPRTSNTSILPSTLALNSISGHEISIEERPVFKKVARYETRLIRPAEPARTTTVTFDEPIPFTSDSSNNCPTADCSDVFKNTEIEDGAVVVAQEIYYAGDHSKGINRSRITVIADADMIQGNCIFDDDGSIKPEHKDFLQSLYPDTIFPTNLNARIFDVNKKIISDERGSPARYYHGFGKDGLIGRFIPEQGTPSSGLLMQDFRDVSDTAIERPVLDDTNQTSVFSAFIDSQSHFGVNSKFSQNFSGVSYSDANVLGGLPDVLRDHNVDFLDFRAFPSGYPGDLFGFDIAYYNGHLVIGSPYAAYERTYITPWSEVSGNTPQFSHPSGIVVSNYGGAGSVYVYNQSSNGDWDLKQKLRPDGINVGQDLSTQAESILTAALGANNYDLDFLLEYSPITDKFGYSVDIHGDVIAVGAPGHDYPVEVDVTVQGAFETRSFNFEFDIETRISKDLGDEEVRLVLGVASGVLNNGAIFTFENRFGDKISGFRNWEFVEKLIPQGYNSRVQEQVAASGTENENFGESLAIYRPKRRDADYTVAIGTPYHKFATSGNHISTEPLEDAGAVTTFDAMLRTNNAFSAASGSGAFIDAFVYGIARNQYSVNLYIDNTDLDKDYYANGVVYANNEGEIFIEASGQDLNANGFTVHRPYIQSVLGGISRPTSSSINDNFSLYTSAITDSTRAEMPLYCLPSNKANVYNSVGMFVDSIDLAGSNIMPLFVTAGSGTPISDDDFNLFVSGVGNPDDNIHLITFGF